MRTAWHDAFGSATGPVMRSSPRVRLLSGVLVLLTCVLVPTTSLEGLCLAITAATLWSCLCRPPRNVLGRTALLALAMFLPTFLLLPLMPPGGQAPLFSMVFKGMMAVLTSLATMSALSAADLHQALLTLPLPTLVVEIVVQVIHQTLVLIGEVRRIATAMAVRGATGGQWRALFGVPHVFLPRVISRAERVAAAMEVRGYSVRVPTSGDRPGSVAITFLVLGFAGGALALAAALRILQQ